jgi:hypothetical protein
MFPPSEVLAIKLPLQYDNINQCCESGSFSVRTRIRHFRSIRIRIQRFDDQKFKSIIVKQKSLFFTNN